jgi:hypothetical protein
VASATHSAPLPRTAHRETFPPDPRLTFADEWEYGHDVASERFCSFSTRVGRDSISAGSALVQTSHDHRMRRDRSRLLPIQAPSDQSSSRIPWRGRPVYRVRQRWPTSSGHVELFAIAVTKPPLLQTQRRQIVDPHSLRAIRVYLAAGEGKTDEGARKSSGWFSYHSDIGSRRTGLKGSAFFSLSAGEVGEDRNIERWIFGWVSSRSRCEMGRV